MAEGAVTSRKTAGAKAKFNFNGSQEEGQRRYTENTFQTILRTIFSLKKSREIGAVAGGALWEFWERCFNWE